MLEAWFSGNLVFALLAWSTLFTSDYYLSLYASRLYQAGVHKTLVYQGGIELTPQFRQDIAETRWFSPRWLANLVLIDLLLAAIWVLVWLGFRDFTAFDFVVGGLVLLELTIHARHIRVLALYRRVLAGDGPMGKIEYPRWLLLDQSGVEFATFAALYAVAFLWQGGVFFLGGAIFVAAIAVRHALWGRQARGENASETSKTP